MENKFDYHILTPNDFEMMLSVLGLDQEDSATRFSAICRLVTPSAIVRDEDGPIMYRWHLAPRSNDWAVYLHVQVRSDGIKRGPHDHMYDSFSNILAGSYVDEEWFADPTARGEKLILLSMAPYCRGDTVIRRAAQLHRVVLPEGVPYSISLFSAGRRYREWGFANPDGTWSPADDVGKIENGVLVAFGRQAT